VGVGGEGRGREKRWGGFFADFWRRKGRGKRGRGSMVGLEEEGGGKGGRSQELPKR